MHRQTTIALITILLVALCCGALGAEYHVNQDGTGDFTAVQAAIDGAADGDEIVVHPGTYYENIHFDGKNITLRSRDPEDEEIVASTIIDGGQEGSVVTFAGTEDETCLLSGFTIMNGKADQVGGGIRGGDSPRSTRATIINSTITGNSAGWGGGGLCFCGGRITNCAITGNSVTGPYGFGGGLLLCDGPFSGCTITGNSATGEYAWGGGLSGCSGAIRECTISGNSGWWGGGLDGCDGPISNCTISDNSAEFGGGGLSFCSGAILNCTITGNTADKWGGGLDGCDGPITDCTISDNLALREGGGLYGLWGTISNCIVWGNYAELEGNELYLCADAVITYCCIRGWTRGGEGNISDDPLFVTGPLGDYYLSCRAAGQGADSPCIDAGGDTAEALGLDELTTRTDCEPDGGVVDMGYHYPTTTGEGPVIECSLNDNEFSAGELLVALCDIDNPGPDVTVDVYFAFVMPDGAILCISPARIDFGIFPCMTDLFLHQGYSMEPTPLLSIAVPGGLPVGNYLFAGALSEPGQFEVIGDVSLFEFALTE